VTDEPDVPSRLTIQRDGATIAIAGELDAHSAPALRDELATSTGPHDTVVDMSGVTFMDSSGLRVLIDAHQRAADSDSRLVLSAPSTSVRRVLEIAGVLDHLEVRSSVAPDGQ
jgi:anti-sigma B factor antagonist